MIANIELEKDEEEFYEDDIPKWFIDKISNYADRLEEKDLISKEDFFKFIDEEIFRLNSQK